MSSCTSTCSRQHFVSLVCLCQEWSVCCSCRLWISCSHQREQRRSCTGEFWGRLVSERTNMALLTCSVQSETTTFTPNTDSTLDILVRKQFFYNFAWNCCSLLPFTVLTVIVQFSTQLHCKDIKIPSKHNRFIMIYHFRATCFDSLESSSGPLMNWPKTI